MFYIIQQIYKVNHCLRAVCHRGRSVSEVHFILIWQRSQSDFHIFIIGLCDRASPETFHFLNTSSLTFLMRSCHVRRKQQRRSGRMNMSAFLQRYFQLYLQHQWCVYFFIVFINFYHCLWLKQAALSRFGAEEALKDVWGAQWHCLGVLGFLKHKVSPAVLNLLCCRRRFSSRLWSHAAAECGATLWNL